MDTAKRKKISSGSSDRAFFLEAKPSWKEGETKEFHTRVVFRLMFRSWTPPFYMWRDAISIGFI